ncbi:MAG: S8 family serine peptidase, partial [Herbiconiux sp.]|nr:S8 family serine peptidase [Herbiconiux sp.]
MNQGLASRWALVVGAFALAGVWAVAPPVGATASASAAVVAEGDGMGASADRGGVAWSLQVLAQAEEGPSSASAQKEAGFTGVGEPLVDDLDRVTVSVRFSSVSDQTAGLPVLQSLGSVRSVTTSLPTIVVALPTEAFETAAELDGVVSVAAVTLPRGGSAAVGASPLPISTPAAASPSCRTVPVNSDGPLRSDVARAAFGVDGTGVTVGILSNSFDELSPAFTAVSDLAQDIAAGSLPGPGNPCGYTTPVQVLADDTPADDEGRAMAQTVHGIAPGAKLLFAAAGLSEAEYADRIQLLVDNGAQVIVDDDVLYSEPWFQQGVIAQKIAEVRAAGVLYLAAAQNQTSIGQSGDWKDRPTGSWEADAYQPTSCPAAIVTALAELKVTDPYDCNDFGAGSTSGASRAELGASVLATNPAGGYAAVQWAQPTDGATTSLYPFVLTERPAPSGSAPAAGEAAPGDAPAPEWAVASGLFVPDDRMPSILAAYVPPATGVVDMRFVVVRVLTGSTPAATPRFRLMINFDDAGVHTLDRPTPPPGVTVGPSIFAHPSDPATFTVGAAAAPKPGMMEPYSGIGPVQYYFEPVRADGRPAAAIAAPEPRAKPDITSVDQPETTFFNQLYDGHYYFGGTSAAAPNAAGVAALAMQYSPQSSIDAVQAAMESTASAMPEQAWDYGVGRENWQGAGLLDAEAALAALPAGPVPTPAPTPVPVPVPDTPAQPAGDGSTRL